MQNVYAVFPPKKLAVLVQFSFLPRSVNIISAQSVYFSFGASNRNNNITAAIKGSSACFSPGAQ